MLKEIQGAQNSQNVLETNEQSRSTSQFQNLLQSYSNQESDYWCNDKHTYN